MGGHDLDRFSRYAFGTFDNRLHGYPAALVRYDKGAVVRTAVAWSLRADSARRVCRRGRRPRPGVWSPASPLLRRRRRDRSPRSVPARCCRSSGATASRVSTRTGIAARTSCGSAVTRSSDAVSNGGIMRGNARVRPSPLAVVAAAVVTLRAQQPTFRATVDLVHFGVERRRQARQADPGSHQRRLRSHRGGQEAGDPVLLRRQRRRSAAAAHRPAARHQRQHGRRSQGRAVRRGQVRQRTRSGR